MSFLHLFNVFLDFFGLFIANHMMDKKSQSLAINSLGRQSHISLDKSEINQQIEEELPKKYQKSHEMKHMIVDSDTLHPENTCSSESQPIPASDILPPEASFTLDELPEGNTIQSTNIMLKTPVSTTSVANAFLTMKQLDEAEESKTSQSNISIASNISKFPIRDSIVSKQSSIGTLSIMSATKSTESIPTKLKLEREKDDEEHSHQIKSNNVEYD